MKKKYFLLLSCFLYCFFTFSQKEANFWFLGEDVGLDFNSNLQSPLVIDMPNFYRTASPSSICDKDGNLVLFVAHSFIFNKNFEQIGFSTFYNNHSMGRVIIVPQPNSQSRYFIFITPDTRYENLEPMHYHVVDIEADGGKGKAIELDKPLGTPTGRKIAVTRHANGKDYWIMTHKWNSDEFVAHLLTEQGIQVNKAISKIGSIHRDPRRLAYGPVNADGQMKFSPSGERLALAISESGILEIFDFDKETGKLSCSQSFSYENEKLATFGLEFSSNGRFLYFNIATNRIATLQNSTGKLVRRIYQIDLEEASLNHEIVYEETGAAIFPFLDMQLAPNGKIYTTTLLEKNTDRHYLHSIEKPNEKGTACMFGLNTVDINRTRNTYLFYHLPQFVSNFLPNEAPIKEPLQALPLEMPNAFSPNGDGINDYFIPITYPYNLTSATLSIYNTWGKLVYSTDDLLSGWNGSNLPNGTYYYSVQYTTTSQTGGTRCEPIFTTTQTQLQKGWVQIIR